MPTRVSDPLHHDLQQHAASLRSLARDLLRDAHAAEDVTQATLQQALVKRPPHADSLGGWLATTLVNFVRQWRRGERRRTTREAALPRQRAEASVAEALVRREMLAAVTDAVLALDEPYQTAIFLRYFENLPPRTIAQRTGANVATVKSRLARGLVLLRHRLDKGSPPRRAWQPALACAFGLPTFPILLLPTGALLVSATAKLLLAAGLLCIGGWLMLQRDDATLTQRAATEQNGQSAAATAAGALDTAKQSPTAERVAAEGPAPEPWLLHPFTMELEVRIVDPLGLPVQGHTLQLAPFGCPMCNAPAATDADGRVLVSWRSRTPSMEIDFAEPLGLRRRLQVEQGKRTSIVLLGEASSGQSFRLVSSTNGNGNVAVLGDVPVLSSFFRANSFGGGDTGMRAGLHPFASFGESCLVPIDPPTEEGPASEVTFTLGSRNISFSLDALTFKVDNDGKAGNAAPEAARIAGTVFDEQGKPQAKTAVALLGAGPQPVQRVETDDAGAFVFENVVAGNYTVRAGGDRAGLGTSSAVATTGTTPTTVHLRTGSCIRGRALDAAGKAMANARLEWRAADGSWVDGTRTGDDGSFVFANLPGGPGSVLLFPGDGERRLPLAQQPALLPDTGDVLLQPKDAGSSLRVQPIRTAGAGAPTVRAWQIDTGLAMRMKAPEGEGDTWTLDHLPAGFYELEAHSKDAGRKPLGRHWLDGKATVDLGRVELAKSGEIAFTLPPGLLPASAEQQACELYQLRRDTDVRGEASPPPLDKAIRLPIGDWVFAFKAADGSVRFHRFSVRAGERTVIAPPAQ